MKKIILASLILFTTVSFAQEIKYGAKAGINVSNLRGDYPDEIDENKSKIGFHIGGFLEYSINDKFSIQPELLFSSQGGNSEIKESYEYNGVTYYESFTQTPKISYLNIPLMLKYKVIEKLSIEFGPQIGFVLNAKSKWEYVDTEDSSYNETIEVDILNGGNYNYLGTDVEVKGRINKFDFGLNLGASYDITEQIIVQARYNLGLSVVDDNSTAGTSTDSWDLKNSVIQFSLGYKF